MLLGAVAVGAVHIVQKAHDHQAAKYDLSNLTHMRYSLFSINTWKSKLSRIVVDEIQNFKVDGRSRDVIKKHLEEQLDVLIDKVNEQIKESNKQSANGWFKQQMMDMLVDIDDIKKGIPNYAEAMVEKMTDNQTQDEFKDLVTNRVKGFLAKTFEKEDTSFTDEIVRRRGAKTLEEARDRLALDVPAEEDYLFKQTWALIGLSLLLFVVAGFHRATRIPPFYFFVCALTLLILLYAGVTCPMIDMDAKITRFGFVLLGHKIEFLNQTVYFQSKSVLDVFWIMITHEKTEMRFVGFLLILFSIIFPTLKILCSIVYYFDIRGLRNNRFLNFMALKSGKWSMADVQVVAIAMAFIGFNGMVSTQLGIIQKILKDMDFITTNATTLQVGFYIFLTYVMLSLIFSTILVRLTPTDPAQH
jgi:hypothetical protein